MIKKVFPILAISIFASMLGVGIIAPFLPIYSQNMGATGIWIGIIFGSFSVSRAIILPFTGRLSDLRGRKLFLCIGLAIYSLVSLGYVLANSINHLIIIRLVQGAASGMILPIAMAYIGDLSPEGEEGKWMGYSNASFFSGFAIGPLLGGALADRFGMDIAFFTMGGFNLLALLLVIFLLPEVSRREKAAESHSSFKKMSTSRIFRGLFSYRVTYALSRGVIFSFLALFTASNLDLNTTLIGIVLTTHMLLTSLIQPYLGNLADKYNRRTMVIIGSIIVFVFLALIPMTRDFWQLLGLSIFGSLGVGISMPAATAMSVEEGRKFGMGSTISMLTLAMAIGMAIGPVICGAIADAVNIGSVFYFAAAMGLIGTGLFAWFSR